MEKWQSNETIIIWISLFGLILVACAIFFVIYIKISTEKIINNNKRENTLKLEYQKSLLNAYLDTQEEERRVIAQRLHDDIGSKLNTLNLWFQNEDTWNHPKFREVFTDMFPDIIEGIRTVSYSMYPSNLEELGLPGAIEELISNLDVSIAPKFYLHTEFKKKERSIALHLYRIIQEFISNTIKYAKADQITINLRDTDNCLIMLLTDNGIGFDFELVKKGMGLKNIDSRSKSIEAKYKWKKSAKGGTRLIILRKQINV